MSDDINRQMGEVSVTVEYMKEQIDKLVAKMDKQQADIDEIKMQIAEFRGAKKLSEWVRSIIAGIVGAVASLISVLSIIRGMQ